MTDQTPLVGTDEVNTIVDFLIDNGFLDRVGDNNEYISVNRKSAIAGYVLTQLARGIAQTNAAAFDGATMLRLDDALMETASYWLAVVQRITDGSFVDDSPNDTVDTSLKPAGVGQYL